jgi:hypothetical protein
MARQFTKFGIPKNLMIGRRDAVVGVHKRQDASTFYDYPEIIALLHIMRIERLTSADQSNVA